MACLGRSALDKSHTSPDDGRKMTTLLIEPFAGMAGDMFLAALLDLFAPDPNAVIWWSNVFFTFFSNWHYSIEEREAIYATWIRKLSEKNRNAFLYGNDYNNFPIEGVRAAEYSTAYFASAENYLEPREFQR